MSNQEIYDDLKTIILNTYDELNDYTCFKDGTPKMIVNEQAVNSLSKVILKLIELEEKIEGDVK